MSTSKRQTRTVVAGTYVTLTLLVLMVLGMIGCAGSGQAVKMEDISPLSADQGRIIFYRTSMLFGSGMKPDIYLNGEKVGRSVSGTMFYVDVDPGEYKVSIAKIMYPGTPGGVDLEVGKNETVYVRTWTGGGSFSGRTDAGVVSSDIAEEHVRKVKMVRF